MLDLHDVLHAQVQALVNDAGEGARPAVILEDSRVELTAVGLCKVECLQVQSELEIYVYSTDSNIVPKSVQRLHPYFLS